MVKNRPFINIAIKLFSIYDLYCDPKSYNDLRDFIGQPIQEWNNETFLFANILKEEWEIKQELQSKYPFLQESLTKDKCKDFLRKNEQMKKSAIWKRWQNLLRKKEGFKIKLYPRLEEETQTTKSLISFYQNGRNIFSLSPFLIHLLNCTNIGDFRFSDLKLPYKSIYLHFGVLTNIEYFIDYFEQKQGIVYEYQDVDRKLYLDGAFVTSCRQSSLDIRLTFIDKKQNFEQNISIEKDLRFPTINFTLDFGKINWETKEYVNDDQLNVNNSIICFSDIWDQKNEPCEIKFDKLQRLMNQPENCHENEWEEYNIFYKSLVLIINTIVYLNFGDNDMEISATNKLAAQLEKEILKTNNSNQINELNKKLKMESYSRIHFCGNNSENKFNITETGININSNWRK